MTANVAPDNHNLAAVLGRFEIGIRGLEQRIEGLERKLDDLAATVARLEDRAIHTDARVGSRTPRLMGGR